MTCHALCGTLRSRAHMLVEYDSWEERELGRISRYKTDQERALKEAVEREQMRTMTDEERKALERERHAVSHAGAVRCT